MTENAKPDSVFDHLEELSDVDIAALTQAAIHVLQIGSDDESLREIEAMPTRPLQGTLQDELAARAITNGAVAERIVTDRAIARPVAIRLLETIAQDPAIAGEVEAAYQKRRKLLTVGVDLILAAALMVVVLKIKRVRIGKADVQFGMLSDKVVEKVLSFVNPVG